jgi:hypothetical protein
MRKTFIVGSICSLLALGPALAQRLQVGENLLVEIPGEFESAYHLKTDQGEINEFVREGETVEEWTEMITVQLFPPETDNRSFFRRFEALSRQSCKDSSIYVVATEKENGYRVKVFELYCPTNLQTQKGEVTFLKTLQGRDKFYVVQKAWRTDPFLAWIPTVGQGLTSGCCQC